MFSILVFSHGELIGDGMIKLPFLKALRQTYPDAHITWLCGRHPTIFQTALREMTQPYLDEVIFEPTLGDRFFDIFGWRVRRVLHKRTFDVIFDTEHKLIPTLMLKRISHQLFISASFGSYFSHKKPISKHIKPPLLRDQLIELVALASGRMPDVDETMNVPAVYQHQAQEILTPYQEKGPVILLAPGAGGRFKCWPLDSFIQLACTLCEKDVQVGFILGPQETDWQLTLQNCCPKAFFPLQMSLEKSPFLTIALAQRAAVNVANDGGVGHILAASNQHTISMWGPTDPLKSKPNGKNVHVVTAQEFGGGAMPDIPVQAIFERVERLLYPS